MSDASKPPFEDEQDNVIPIRRPAMAGDDVPARRFYSDKKDCSHKRTEVDARARVVRCRDCHAPLDPIAVIESFARTGDSFIHLNREHARLQKEIATLKDEVAKLKAAKRRATK